MLHSCVTGRPSLFFSSFPALLLSLLAVTSTAATLPACAAPADDASDANQGAASDSTGAAPSEVLAVRTPPAEGAMEGTGDLVLTWKSSGPVDVFAGTSPDGASDTFRTDIRTLPGATVQDGRATIPAAGAQSQQRWFFKITNRSSHRYAIAAERRLPLLGASNFRDLGGYRTASGATVSWGHVYRSDELARLIGKEEVEDPASPFFAQNDVTYLSSLKIARVFDLRGDFEVSSSPDRLERLQPAPEGVRVAIFDPRDDFNKNVGEGMSNPDPEAGAAQLRALLGGGKNVAIMTGSYRHFIDNDVGTKAYKTLLTHVAEDDASRPIVFHCTSGKDRTGTGAALILLALGVSRADVMADYLLSNANLAARIKGAIDAQVGRGALSATEAKALFEPVLGVQAPFLEAALDTIGKLFPARTFEESFEKYLTTSVKLPDGNTAGLGLAPETVAKLRQKHLSPK